MATSVKIGKDLSTPDYSFDDDTITSMVVDTAVNLIMDEITADTAEITVIYTDTNGSFLELPWATPVYIYNDGILTGKFYSKKVTQVGSITFKIECTSVVGLLDYDTYYGRVYNGETFHTAVEAIISTNGLTDDLGASRTARVCCKDPTDTFYGPYLVKAAETEATLRPVQFYSFEVSLTLNRSLLSEVPVASLANATACCDVLAGAGPPLVTLNHPEYFKYGLYMNLTRASTSDPWPDYGEVFFSYYTLDISLGTPTAPTTYDIYCDPINHRVTINGTDYELPYPVNDQTRTSNQSAGTRFFRNAYGGQAANPSSSAPNYTDASLPHDVVYRKWKVNYASAFTTSGTTPNAYDYIASDAYYVSYIDAFVAQGSEGGYYSSNAVDGYRRSTAIVNMELPPETFAAFQSSALYAEEILNSIQYAPGIDLLPIYGWMPVCSKREALHQLMFSQGVILRKDANGNLLFGAPSSDYYDEISADEIYESGTEAYLEHTNMIKVTEHSYQYQAGMQSTTIYSTDIPTTSDFVFVTYQTAPIHGDPTNNGLSLYAWNCNAAIVGGVGELTGVPYEHTKSIVTRTVGNYADGRELSVTDATLVTYLNSGNVMDRLASYYGNAYTISNAIMLRNERTGNYYKFTSPFGDIVYGFLKKINRVVSSVVKGNCEFLCNYEPADIGLGYQNFVILTGSGTWTVPESVFQKTTPRFRAILIAGGKGGNSGKAGENGQTTQRESSSTAAKGGYKGDPGTGGRFYEVTIENPAYSYTYSVGQGGAGGDVCTSHSTSNVGGQGSDSTLSDGSDTYSSALGSSSEYGYVNFFTGDVYAKSPEIINCSIGAGDGGYVSQQNNRWGLIGGIFAVSIAVNGQPTHYSGGTHGANYPAGSSTIYASGGCGGGAGVGSNGSNGASATISGGIPRAGNGGNGGDATWIPPSPLEYSSTYYGYGGFGGGGGGGGGASGTATAQSASQLGTPGTGGKGGKGGVGASGCILIYY